MPEEMVKMGSALPIPSCQVAHKASRSTKSPPSRPLHMLHKIILIDHFSRPVETNNETNNAEEH